MPIPPNQNTPTGLSEPTNYDMKYGMHTSDIEMKYIPPTVPPHHHDLSMKYPGIQGHDVGMKPFSDHSLKIPQEASNMGKLHPPTQSLGQMHPHHQQLPTNQSDGQTTQNHQIGRQPYDPSLLKFGIPPTHHQPPPQEQSTGKQSYHGENLIKAPQTPSPYSESSQQGHKYPPSESPIDASASSRSTPNQEGMPPIPAPIPTSQPHYLQHPNSSIPPPGHHPGHFLQSHPGLSLPPHHPSAVPPTSQPNSQQTVVPQSPLGNHPSTNQAMSTAAAVAAERDRHASMLRQQSPHMTPPPTSSSASAAAATAALMASPHSKLYPGGPPQGQRGLGTSPPPHLRPGASPPVIRHPQMPLPLPIPGIPQMPQNPYGHPLLHSPMFYPHHNPFNAPYGYPYGPSPFSYMKPPTGPGGPLDPATAAVMAGHHHGLPPSRPEPEPRPNSPRNT
uniref:Uncharacterized protein n=1 Tax=Megaselia scalaris TaxID=36166 RepID=T1GD06_MEGSC